MDTKKINVVAALIVASMMAQNLIVHADMICHSDNDCPKDYQCEKSLLFKKCVQVLKEGNKCWPFKIKRAAPQPCDEGLTCGYGEDASGWFDYKCVADLKENDVCSQWKYSFRPPCGGELSCLPTGIPWLSTYKCYADLKEGDKCTRSRWSYMPHCGKGLRCAPAYASWLAPFKCVTKDD